MHNPLAYEDRFLDRLDTRLARQREQRPPSRPEAVLLGLPSMDFSKPAVNSAATARTELTRTEILERALASGITTHGGMAHEGTEPWRIRPRKFRR